MKRVLLFITPIVIVTLLLALLISPAFAEKAETAQPSEGNDLVISQEDKTAETDLNLDKSYFSGYFSDTKEILISPIHWKKEDWLRASLVLGTTIILYNNDPAIQNYFQEHLNQTTDGISGIAKVFGDYRVAIPSLALFYAYGASAKDAKAQQTALLSLESLTIAGGFTCAFKLAGHRHRPYTGDPYNTWDGPSLTFDDNDLSFPSFHSSTAFAVATVMSTEYADHKWVPYLAYSLATLTALSRVNDNVHWSSDVFFGSAVGYFTAKAIIYYHQKGAANNITIAPIINEKNVGLSLSYDF